MIKLKIALLATICVVLLCGCRQEVSDVLSRRASWSLKVYENGRIVASDEIASGTPKYRDVIDWARSKEDGWSPSFVSYVPGIELSGPDFSVSISRKKLVLVVESQEYTRPLSEQDYRRIEEILEVGPSLGGQQKLQPAIP